MERERQAARDRKTRRRKRARGSTAGSDGDEEDEAQVDGDDVEDEDFALLEAEKGAEEDVQLDAFRATGLVRLVRPGARGPLPQSCDRSLEPDCRPRSCS